MDKLKEHKLLVIILVFLFVILLFSAGKDSFVGFYYPDKDDLSVDIQSVGIFDSLEECRSWVDFQRRVNNPYDNNYDYECGKNCDMSEGKPYICEETLQ